MSKVGYRKLVKYKKIADFEKEELVYFEFSTQDIDLKLGWKCSLEIFLVALMWFISGILPTISASNLNPVEALRSGM